MECLFSINLTSDIYTLGLWIRGVNVINVSYVKACALLHYLLKLCKVDFIHYIVDPSVDEVSSSYEQSNFDEDISSWLRMNPFIITYNSFHLKQLWLELELLILNGWLEGREVSRHGLLGVCYESCYGSFDSFIIMLVYDFEWLFIGNWKYIILLFQIRLYTFNTWILGLLISFILWAYLFENLVLYLLEFQNAILFFYRYRYILDSRRSFYVFNVDVRLSHSQLNGF